MKLLYLTPKSNGPSARWRIHQMLPRLQEHGITGSVEEIPGGTFARLAMAKRAAAYDAVVLQKWLAPRLVTYRLRKYARRLIYEFDEAVVVKRNGGTPHPSVRRERRFRRIVRLSDAVAASCEYLADLARGVAAKPEKVGVLPNAIDLGQWKTRPQPQKGPAKIIGWFGAPSNLPQLEIVGQPLLRLSRRYEDLNVHVLCDRSTEIEGIRLKHRKCDPNGEVAEVQSFDIALAPLIEDLWTRGKVSMKLLTYFAAGIPVVASDVTANRLYIRDGENGFLCGTLTRWEETLEKLIEDPGLRAEVGTCARRTVEREASLDAVLPKYVEFIEHAVQAAPAAARGT